MKADPIGDTVVQKGQGYPFPSFLITNDDDTIFDLTGFVPILKLTRPDGTTSSIVGTTDIPAGRVDVAWGTFTETPGNYPSILMLNGPAFISPFFGPTYVVYDPADLWVNPYEIEQATGGEYTDTEVIRAILLAQSLVGAWVSFPVQSPVPEAIRQATSLIAVRALTRSTSGGSVPGGAIIGESIGDYSVRYADPVTATDPYIFGADIHALLDPYHARIGMTVIGPASARHPLPLGEEYVVVVEEEVVTP